MKISRIFDRFRFESKANRIRQEKKYFRLMFPMGDAQRNWEISTIKSLFPDMETRFQEIHFTLLTLREAMVYANLDIDDDDYTEWAEGYQDWLDSSTTNQFDKETTLPLIYAMAELENKASDLSQLPTKEEIITKSIAQEFPI